MKNFKQKTVTIIVIATLLLVSALSLFTACGKKAENPGGGETPATYTITFNSTGGSAVSAIEAAAGAKIESPEKPTKEGVVFAGWYESADNGKTLSDKPFEFSYMPAKSFTLYAKWADVNINGKTFKKTATHITWLGTEEEKKAMLKEMDVSEEEYIATAESLVVEFIFHDDGKTASAKFGLGDDMYNPVVLYRISGNLIVFYENEEDMKNGIPAHNYGFFVGATITLSDDKTTLTHTQSVSVVKIENVCTVTK